MASSPVLLCAAAALLCLTSLLSTVSPATASVLPFPGTFVDTHTIPAFEPSGLAYIEPLASFLVIDDGGKLGLLEPITDEWQEWRPTTETGNDNNFIALTDFEAVAVVDSTTTVVYLVLEQEALIWEYDVVLRKGMRVFNISSVLPVCVDNKGGKGGEVLTFIPDENHSPGNPSGALLLMLQRDGSVWEFHFEDFLDSSNNRLRLQSTRLLGIHRPQGGAYDEPDGLLWLTNGGNKEERITVVDPFVGCTLQQWHPSEEIAMLEGFSFYEPTPGVLHAMFAGDNGMKTAGQLWEYTWPAHTQVDLSVCEEPKEKFDLSKACDVSGSIGLGQLCVCNMSLLFACFSLLLW